MTSILPLLQLKMFVSKAHEASCASFNDKRCVLHCCAVNWFAILTETQRDTNTRLLCL